MLYKKLDFYPVFVLIIQQMSKKVTKCIKIIKKCLKKLTKVLKMIYNICEGGQTYVKKYKT